MAINDDAVIAVEGGFYFTAPIGTPFPTDVLVPGTPWENVGNTSLEDILSISSEGGEVTILGTLQNKSLRTRRSPRTETFSINLHQFDKAGLKLYYGANATENADGTLGVPNSPAPTQCAFYAVFTDGATTLPFYAPKCEILRGDDLELNDTESLARLPLSITPLGYQGNSWTYAVEPVADPVVTP